MKIVVLLWLLLSGCVVVQPVSSCSCDEDQMCTCNEDSDMAKGTEK